MIRRLALAIPAIALLAAGGCGGPQRADVEPKPMPEGGSFTGVWHSPQYGEMHLLQKGDRVIGKYTKNERRGRIQGTVQGNLLRFEFEEHRQLVQGNPNITRGRGYFRYVVDPSDDSHKLLGEWGYGNSETGGGEWNAVRLENRKPNLEGMPKRAGSDDVSLNTSSGGSNTEGSL